MHEVGHTLGLRHNFKGSAYISLDDINDPEKSKKNGLSASIMDYLPLNIAPKGKSQGEYFNLVLGPYDYWAIEYGYKVLSGGTEGEISELAKIASRSAEPQLDYATDEDTRENDPDPLTNRFDLGKDAIAFARQRAELVKQLLPDLIDITVEQGENYSAVRRAFSVMMNDYNTAMGFVAKNVGGLYVHRDHKGDPKARPPFEFVEPAKQRESLDLLDQYVFGPDAYQFPPELFNFMALEKWEHWV